MFLRLSASPSVRKVLLAALTLAVTVAAPAADHRDGPRITDLNNTLAGALDLNDLYLFVSPTNASNVVLIQTMSPGAGVVGPGFFFPGALYELRISNDGNPFTDEIVVQTTFSQPNAAGQQQYLIRAVTAAGSANLGTGVTNGKVISLSGGGKATAGIFDDPFFFDVNATARFNREATRTTLGLPLPDVKAGEKPARHFFPPNFPQNFFGGANTLAIAIEVPRTRLLANKNQPNITAWIRSVADIGDGRGFTQFDRTALPSVNTVVTPLTRTINREILPNGLQDQFNLLNPSRDPSLRSIIVNRL